MVVGNAAETGGERGGEGEREGKVAALEGRAIFVGGIVLGQDDSGEDGDDQQ